MTSVLSELLDVDRVALDDRGAVLAVVTFTRTEDMNPLDWDTVRAMRATFRALAEDPEVRVVAITGRGRAFSAGGDMKRYATLQRDPVGFPGFLDDWHALVQEIAEHPKPYVALVNGVTVAGGIELLLACDVAIAAESARIGDAHQVYGQMGGGGVLALLPHAVGPARARELIFTGRMMDSDEALGCGLVCKVVPDAELLDAGVEFAKAVAAKSPLSIANAKAVTNSGYWDGTGLRAALLVEKEVTARYCLTSEDAHLGLEAFARKERPNFVGR